ncbi:MAG: alanine dehydrogenase, partial [Cryomorphaceae bacterium]
EVSPEAYLLHSGKRPVFTVLGVEDYNAKSDRSEFSKTEFYEHPDRFDSNFMRFAKVSDLYVSCHYWDAKAPFIFTREDARSDDFNIKVVADISCDIDGPVASTLRPSTIADPLYGYNPKMEKETDFSDPAAIGVMAVDNLPCELPKDASEDFGDELIKHIIPELLKDNSDVIYRATETNLEGELTEPYAYLKDFVEGKE